MGESMRRTSHGSFFLDLHSRELNSSRVRKRADAPDYKTEAADEGAIALEHDGMESPPLALSFCKTSRCSHILAVSDEDGYLSLFDMRKKLHASVSHQDNADQARVAEWVAHQNAIFDISWIKDDANMLTASGDQMIRVWDVENKNSLVVLKGHEGSVKSICSHPTNSDLLVSGSRDGCFSLWDLRCNPKGRNKLGEPCLGPIKTIKGAHNFPNGKRVRAKKAASMSITSVLFLKDGCGMATAGALDSVVKFWDPRNLTLQLDQTCANYDSNDEKDKSLHGISSLSQDMNGVLLSVSCMDNRIYLYDILRLEKGPVSIFTGCNIQSFYIKSVISPDSSYLLSGSSDGCGYIWQVDRPDADPIVLNCYSGPGEVTAVAWSPTGLGKFATCSDDFTVRKWSVQTSYCVEAKSSPATRRRVMAMSPSEGIKLLKMEGSGGSESVPTKVHNHISDEGDSLQMNPTSPQTEVATPKAQRKIMTLGVPREDTTPKAHKNSTPNPHCGGICEKTPEATLKSPSSVLTPPSSMKRTIRDYFLAVNS
ncbi:hypothetical protein MLD38_000146 [Melastoma candidum]|uniref:Uncharacterized protein n=1 Tax=Melastoma candidum TaxID=119954 RepID=A0ACB9SA32_9MYRT|nr:hypothetical protein MLD38_000146 [Melastoma candidum]